ncbi:hypothetical protein [Streptomyces sp. CdTB01]|uniref:hypothetical protein n=1 Tax=Streptomyces sp. CdTB01 TaxID=1725411 RepID=UPI00073A7164|nr:hypothetical protein [Streptomyces sp. CdTB01]ALV33083.1 hypothetical protein AS200_14245 [Streptomyces sp. CdTB01]
MTGYSDAYTPSSMAAAIQVASDIKEDQNGLLSWASVAGIIAMVLVVALAVFLTIELAWRERRQRKREEQTAPTLEVDPHKGEISP